MKFEWRALRTGDRVLVHDPVGALLALTPGVVSMLDAHKGANGVGIRVGPAGQSSVLWPSYLAVHSDPRDMTQPCWRCEALEN
jgi:hypothetical protein